MSGEGRTAGIIGAGSAGIFALQLARLAGFFDQIVVSDLDESRLLQAKARSARTATVHAPEHSFVAAAQQMTDGAGLDLVIEAAGFDDCRADCIEAVRYLGRVGYFGLPENAGLVDFPLAAAFGKGCAIEMAGTARSARKDLDPSKRRSISSRADRSTSTA